MYNKNMANKQLKKRWTIINVEVEIKDSIVAYANDNGYSIARALKELSKKELRKWKRRSEKQ